MILYNKRITKALIRLHACAGCSVPLLFINPEDRFSRVVAHMLSVIYSFPTSDHFCLLLITFANSLYPDQARQNVGPDLDRNCLTL